MCLVDETIKFKLWPFKVVAKDSLDPSPQPSLALLFLSAALTSMSKGYVENYNKNFGYHNNNLCLKENVYVIIYSMNGIF